MTLPVPSIAPPTSWRLPLLRLFSDWILPVASVVFVAGYWVLGLIYYYSWPDMQEHCQQ